MTLMRPAFHSLIALMLIAGNGQTAAPGSRSVLAEHVTALTRNSVWKPVASIPVRFKTFHPQGMVKIGDTFFVSSVEVRNRDGGDGTGHLFRIDNTGHLLADLKLGEGPIYHPGGIDYDGQSIWVPVAEYRPDSRSIVYRVDPKTMKANEVLRFADHIGAIVRNTDDDTLHGVSWGRGGSIAGHSAAMGRSPTALLRRNGCVRSTPLTISTIRTASTPGRGACSAQGSRRCASPRRHRCSG